MRRWLFCAALVPLLFVLPACDSNGKPAANQARFADAGVDDAVAARGDAVAAAAKPAAAPAGMVAAPGMPVAPPKAADAAVKPADPKPADTPPPPKSVQSGLLTAGSFDDNLNPGSFRAFCGKVWNHSELGELPSRFAGRRLTVRVTDPNGVPVAGAHVRVSSGTDDVDLRSRTDGRAVAVAGWDKLSSDGDWAVSVAAPGGGAPVVRPVPKDLDDIAIVLGQASPRCRGGSTWRWSLT